MAVPVFLNRFVAIKQFLFILIMLVFVQEGFSQTDSVLGGPEVSGSVQMRGMEPAFLPVFSEPLPVSSKVASFSSIDAQELLKLKIERPDFEFYQSEINPAFPRSYFQNPLISAYSLNSLATYKISERFSLSGSRFSANDVFGIQRLNPSPYEMNIQGVNLQLEYQISDKFRIGGGVQIYHQSNGF
jgi:hypothetical protein